MSTTYAERVADRAQSIHIARVLLSVLAAPFWLLGAACALVALVVTWIWAAACVGCADVRERRGTG